MRPNYGHDSIPTRRLQLKVFLLPLFFHPSGTLLLTFSLLPSSLVLFPEDIYVFLLEKLAPF